MAGGLVVVGPTPGCRRKGATHPVAHPTLSKVNTPPQTDEGRYDVYLMYKPMHIGDIVRKVYIILKTPNKCLNTLRPGMILHLTLQYFKLLYSLSILTPILISCTLSCPLNCKFKGHEKQGGQSDPSHPWALLGGGGCCLSGHSL